MQQKQSNSVVVASSFKWYFPDTVGRTLIRCSYNSRGKNRSNSQCRGAARRHVPIKVGNAGILTDTLHHKIISSRKGYYAPAVVSPVGTDRDWGRDAFSPERSLRPRTSSRAPNSLPPSDFSPPRAPRGDRAGIREFEYEEYRRSHRRRETRLGFLRSSSPLPPSQSSNTSSDPNERV